VGVNCAHADVTELLDTDDEFDCVLFWLICEDCGAIVEKGRRLQEV
jgi:hypothetical protein